MNEHSLDSLKNFGSVLLGALGLCILGMVGYMIIERWNWIDALYMTVITFSTVGFSEVGPMGQGGRFFSMFLILCGLILISMFSASVTSILVRRELLTSFKTKKMKKNIKSLRGHTILCGAGETGRIVIKEFDRARKPLVVIEDSLDVLQHSKEIYPGMLAIEGDATKDEILEEANIHHASDLITALSGDTANFFVVISAKSLKPDIRIVARAVDEHTADKMYKAGATNVISPNITEGMRMAATVLKPTVVSFLDVTTNNKKFELKMEEVQVKPGSSFHGKHLRDLQIPQKTGLIVIGIKKKDQEESGFLYNPGSNTLIHENDVLIVLGDNNKIGKLNILLQ